MTAATLALPPSSDAANLPGGEPAPPPPPAQPATGMPGYKAMWVCVCLEYIEFTVFFAVYFVARWHHPQAFQEGAARLWTAGGLAVTLIMLTSGFALTRAIEATRHGRLPDALRWQWAALAIGLAYPAVKLLEWRWNGSHAIDAGAGIFVIVYYYITINHFIHACWGLFGMAWCLGRAHGGAYTPADLRGLESLATYWHATDLVWLMVFALFYAFA